MALIRPYLSKLLPSFEKKNNHPISHMLSNFEEINDILNNKKDNKIKFLFYNRNKVHDILYSCEKTIEICSEMLGNELSNYFYLALLLEENKVTVDYEYSIDLIRDVCKLIKKENKLRDIILSKIIIILIEHYKETEIFDEDEEKEELENIENNSLETIKNNIKELEKLKMNNDDFKNKKIDEIYIDIINILIKNNKFEDYKYVYNVIKELDLEKINITETMFNELSKTLNINEEYIKNYIILNSKNFSLKEEIINFYYILIKYIFKNSIYIYNIDLLLETRKNILKIMKTNINDLFNNNLHDDIIIKWEFIINFLTDSEYYNKKIISPNNDSTFYKKSKLLSTSSINNENNTYYSIIQFKNVFKKKRYSRFIKVIKNGNIIVCRDDDMLYIYNKDFSYNKIDLNTEINEKNLGTTENIKSKDNFNCKKIIQCIIEKYYNNNIIEMIVCSKIGLIKIKNNFNNNNFEIIKLINLSCSAYFEIKVKNEKNNYKYEYIVIGVKGIFHFDFSPFELDLSSKKELEKYNIIKTNCKAGIKINDNYLALTSNKILPNGEDKLYIYDTKNKTIFKKIDGSFISGLNGLELIETENKNKKYLLCGCKKYISGQENIIMLIEIEIKENGELKINNSIFNTNDFEANCFCQINKEENKNNLSKYLFVGGLDTEKREGAVKLYRLDFSENNVSLEYLQDIEKDNLSFEIFQGTINCIIQLKENDDDILISCMDGNLYLFSKPNIDFYLNKEDSE